MLSKEDWIRWNFGLKTVIIKHLCLEHFQFSLLQPQPLFVSFCAKSLQSMRCLDSATTLRSAQNDDCVVLDVNT